MESLTRTQAESLINEIISDRMKPEQIGELLLTMKRRGETTNELLGFIDGLTKRAHLLQFTPPKPLIDVCGTGGDGAGTFNVSTGVALVLASAGVNVAKHGNRGVSSKSGSSDVLEVLGLGSDTTPEQAIESLTRDHLTFLFAPAFHPVLAKLAPIRKSLGTYTIFNALGPLLNPAPITHQMMGVYHPSLLKKAAEVMRERGLTEGFVVHGSDGLDEITLNGATQFAHLKRGIITEFTLLPVDFGLSRAPMDAVKGGGPQENAEILLKIFQGEKSPRRDLILINAAAAFVLAGKATSFKNGVEVAAATIDSGLTMELLNRKKRIPV